MSHLAIPVLPPEAVAQLQRAARTPFDEFDPLARVKAIEQATRRVKRDYPNFFKEQHHESKT